MSLGREILCIRIKLSKEKSDIISVHERDEPELLSQRFCKKHKLASNFQSAICNMIDKNLDILIDEELNYSKTNKLDLYERGLNAKQKSKEKIENFKVQRLKADSKNLTFKPKILEKSINLLKKKPLKEEGQNKEMKNCVRVTPNVIFTPSQRFKSPKQDHKTSRTRFSPISSSKTLNSPWQNLNSSHSLIFPRASNKTLSIFQSFSNFSNKYLNRHTTRASLN